MAKRSQIRFRETELRIFQSSNYLCVCKCVCADSAQHFPPHFHTQKPQLMAKLFPGHNNKVVTGHLFYYFPLPFPFRRVARTNIYKTPAIVEFYGRAINVYSGSSMVSLPACPVRLVINHVISGNQPRTREHEDEASYLSRR